MIPIKFFSFEKFTDVMVHAMNMICDWLNTKCRYLRNEEV